MESPESPFPPSGEGAGQRPRQNRMWVTEVSLPVTGHSWSVVHQDGRCSRLHPAAGSSRVIRTTRKTRLQKPNQKKKKKKKIASRPEGQLSTCVPTCIGCCLSPPTSLHPHLSAPHLAPLPHILSCRWDPAWPAYLVPEPWGQTHPCVSLAGSQGHQTHVPGSLSAPMGPDRVWTGSGSGDWSDTTGRSAQVRWRPGRGGGMGGRRNRGLRSVSVSGQAAYLGFSKGLWRVRTAHYLLYKHPGLVQRIFTRSQVVQ